MEKVDSLLQIKEAIDSAKSRGQDWVTNLFLEDKKLAGWIDRGQIYLHYAPSNIFILRKRKTFFHCYFVITQMEYAEKDFAELLGGMHEIVVTDVLGGSTDICQVKSVLLRVRFEKYAGLSRMSRCNVPKDPISDEQVEYATAKDAGQVMDILYQTFDPLKEQLPDLEDVVDSIDKRHVVVTRDENGDVSSICIFDRKGVTYHAQYLATRRDADGTGCAIEAHQQAMMRHRDVRRIVLWVLDDNKKIIAIHKMDGFTFDGLHDEVFLYKPES